MTITEYTETPIPTIEIPEEDFFKTTLLDTVSKHRKFILRTQTPSSDIGFLMKCGIPFEVVPSGDLLAITIDYSIEWVIDGSRFDHRFAVAFCWFAFGLGVPISVKSYCRDQRVGPAIEALLRAAGLQFSSSTERGVTRFVPLETPRTEQR